MTGERRLHDTHRQNPARALAQTQAQRQKRLFAQCVQEAWMTWLGADMPGYGVIKRAGAFRVQTGGGGGADKAIEHDRNAQLPRPRHGPGHRHQFAPAQATQDL